MFQKGMLDPQRLPQDSGNICRRYKVYKNYLLHQGRMFQAGMNRRLVILLLGCYRVVLGGKGCLKLGHE
jgi:hypothetical protein